MVDEVIGRGWLGRKVVRFEDPKNLVRSTPWYGEFPFLFFRRRDSVCLRLDALRIDYGNLEPDPAPVSTSRFTRDCQYFSRQREKEVL